MPIVNPFQPGGPVQDYAIYVRRDVDQQALARLSIGECCCWFGPRQSGKTSLAAQLQKTLQAENSAIDTVYYDLVRLGTESVLEAAWYQSLMERLAESLRVKLTSKTLPGPGASGEAAWTRFLCEALPARLKKNTIIFLDEVDKTTLLPAWGQGFYAGLLALLHQQAQKGSRIPAPFVLPDGRQSRVRPDHE